MRTSKVFLIDGQTATNMLKNKHDPLTGFKSEEQLCKDIKDLKKTWRYGNLCISQHLWQLHHHIE